MYSLHRSFHLFSSKILLPMDRNRPYLTNMCKSSIIAHKDFDVTVVTGPMPLALKAEHMVNSQKVRAVLEKSPLAQTWP
jgi:hypothetical protein